MEYLLVCFAHLAQVAAEPVLIEFLVRLGIPQTAGIRTDFIGQHDFAVARLAELDFEVHERDAQLLEQVGQQYVDAARQFKKSIRQLWG